MTCKNNCGVTKLVNVTLLMNLMVEGKDKTKQHSNPF